MMPGTSVSTTASWVRCGKCAQLIYGPKFQRELEVCSFCGWHSPLTAARRLDQLLDQGGRRPIGIVELPTDPLEFTDTQPYPRRLASARERTGLDEAVSCAAGTLLGVPVVLAVMDFRFLGGSLGVAVGELICAAAEDALRERSPLIICTASGGARMQEGALALMQMARTSARMAELDEAGLLTISVLTDPTYGGVAASFASLADILLIEPGARFGFAGPRVIEQTIGRALPPGFQSAEFLLEHGLVDTVVPRAQLRQTLARLLDGQTAQADETARAELITDPDRLGARDPWEVVQRARAIDRLSTLDYVSHLFDDFQELHGDRLGADCPAIVGGLARFGGRQIMVVGQQKGHTTSELIRHNFGMPSPAGYRRVARLLRLAAKLGLPVVTFVDTPGAHPGPEAEEHGQAVAIAENLRLAARLPVPIVTVITGEGGSGGALALAVSDRVFILENSIYSVISPEGCAAILWQSPAAAPIAADALRLTAAPLLRLGVVDAVVPEPSRDGVVDQLAVVRAVRGAITGALAELSGTPTTELLAARRARFDRFGAARLATARSQRETTG